MNTMSDEEFALFLTKFSDGRIAYTEIVGVLSDHIFTEEQITQFCYAMVAPDSLFVGGKYVMQKLLETQKVMQHHSDIFVSSVIPLNVVLWMATCKTLTSDQIDFLLGHGMPHISNAAYNHPCCTDANRVKITLKKG